MVVDRLATNVAKKCFGKNESRGFVKTRLVLTPYGDPSATPINFCGWDMLSSVDFQISSLKLEFSTLGYILLLRGCCVFAICSFVLFAVCFLGVVVTKAPFSQFHGVVFISRVWFAHSLWKFQDVAFISRACSS